MSEAGKESCWSDAGGAMARLVGPNNSFAFAWRKRSRAQAGEEQDDKDKG